MKHSPLPWRIVGKKDPIEILDASGGRVARVAYVGDAQRIVAAPDLYNAVLAYVTECDKPGFPPEGMVAAMLDAMRAALAKAEGR